MQVQYSDYAMRLKLKKKGKKKRKKTLNVDEYKACLDSCLDGSNEL